MMMINIHNYKMSCHYPSLRVVPSRLFPSIHSRSASKAMHWRLIPSYPILSHLIPSYPILSHLIPWFIRSFFPLKSTSYISKNCHEIAMKFGGLWPTGFRSWDSKLNGQRHCSWQGAIETTRRVGDIDQHCIICTFHCVDGLPIC